MKKESINIETHFSELVKMYEEKDEYLNLLVMGDFGSGKTYMARTAPFPVLIDSFDPGGSKSVRDLMAEGKIFADRRWEKEEGERSPETWYAWEKAFNERIKSGFFNSIGTYFFDSLTTASAHIMAVACHKNEKNKEIANLNVRVPQQRDYQVQMLVIENIVKRITSLPCHTVFTCHLDKVKNEDGGVIEYRPLVTGKLAERLPMLFDEVYVAQTKETSRGLEYFFLTRNSGLYKARSRLAATKPLEKLEPQNLKALLKKCDFPHEDKPLPDLQSLLKEKEPKT